MIQWDSALYSPSRSLVFAFFLTAFDGGKVTNARAAGLIEPGGGQEGHGLSLTHPAGPSTLKGLGLPPP
jgi:hypothetical protein